MPLMRDKGSGVVREVHPRYLARFPDHYEPVEAAAEREVQVRIVAPGLDDYLRAVSSAKKRPSKKSAATPTGVTDTREGEE